MAAVREAEAADDEAADEEAEDMVGWVGEANWLLFKFERMNE